MQEKPSASALVLGVFIFAGLATLGYLLGAAALDVRQLERVVTVKGLADAGEIEVQLFAEAVIE